MKLNAYAVYDEVAKVFKHTFFRVRHGEAIRFFADGCRAEKTELNIHPQDFSLFCLAEFDDESGRFESLQIPERVSRASDFVCLGSDVVPTGGVL